MFIFGSWDPYKTAGHLLNMDQMAVYFDMSMCPACSTMKKGSKDMNQFEVSLGVRIQSETRQ